MKKSHLTIEEASHELEKLCQPNILSNCKYIGLVQDSGLVDLTLTWESLNLGDASNDSEDASPENSADPEEDQLGLLNLENEVEKQPVANKSTLIPDKGLSTVALEKEYEIYGSILCDYIAKNAISLQILKVNQLPLGTTNTISLHQESIPSQEAVTELQKMRILTALFIDHKIIVAPILKSNGSHKLGSFLFRRVTAADTKPCTCCPFSSDQN